MRSFIIAGLVLVGVAGCGTNAPDSSSTGTVKDPGYETLSFTTGDFEIPAGDSFECFYTDVITDKVLGILGADGQQMAGGHHITVYWTDNKQAPTHHACKDSEMVAWHMVAGANTVNTGEPVISLPEGMATKMEAGKQIVLQIHYINTTGTPRMVNDSVNIHYEDPSKVKIFANDFFITNSYFSVPPHGKASSTGTCVVPQDLNLVLLVGHQHEWGKHFKLDEVDETGKVMNTIYDHDWEPQYASHPPTNNYTEEKPLHLKKGTRLHQSCDWANDTADPLKFPREMCVMFSMYYPDNGEIDCDFTLDK